MNVDALREVAQYFIDHPHELDMEHWMQRTDPDETGCGTVGCIWGTGCLLAMKENRPIMGKLIFALIERGPEAVNAVDPSLVNPFDLNLEQMQRLYYVENWPRSFGIAYENARRNGTVTEAACITSERIEYFIQTGGVDDGRPLVQAIIAATLPDLLPDSQPAPEPELKPEPELVGV